MKTSIHVAAVGLSTLLCTATALGQSAGREPGPGTPTAGGTTIVNSSNPVTSSGVLRLWQTYATEGARVMLKVYRPEGDRLVLVGTSPLELVPPAEVATFACQIPVSRNDLVGCFCPDDTCVDRGQVGLMLTATGDAGTRILADFTTTAGSPALAAGTTLAIDIPSTASADLVLPVAARTPGAQGTLWTTSLELLNTATTATTVALYFNLSDHDNTTPAASAQLIIPPRATVVLEDLLDEAFELEHATGSVDLVASAPVIAHARIANIAGGAGSYGQTVPAVPARWAVGDDRAPGINPNSDILYLFELRENLEWRSNVGVVNVTAVPLTVEVSAVTTGFKLANTLTIELQPFSHTQLNRILDTLGLTPDTTAARVNVRAVTGSSGRFLAYASRVDNSTGDAVFLLGAREAALAE